ncbi:TIGR03943 family putative permease subunit [Streptomyces sp. NPDC002523]
MRRPAQAALLALTGIGLLHTTLFTDLYLRYVKDGLRPLLIASGFTLLVLGVANAALDGRGTARRTGLLEPSARDHAHGDAHGHPHGDSHGHPQGHSHGDAHNHSHGHDHSIAPRVAWLLVLPAISLLLYAPPALGAYTAAHSANKAVTRQSRFDALPATSPLPMTLTGFTTRVQQDRALAIKGRTVQLTGFVTPVAGNGGWYLTRIIFTCCAADSQSVKIRMYGTETPPADTWLSVTGTWHPKGTLGTRSAEPALDVRATSPIAQPVNAFTDDLPLTPSR